MFTHAFAVAIHHRIVDSGQSKNPANWQESRLVGFARRHSSFRRIGRGEAHRSRAVGARSPGAEGLRTETAEMKKLIIPPLALPVGQSTALAAPGTASRPSGFAV